MAQGKPYTDKQKKEIIRSLKEYLELGYSRNKACDFIGLPPTTLSEWVVNDEALRMKLQGWEKTMSTIARRNVKKKLDEGDATQSNWWLERKEKKEFSTRSELTGEDGGEIPVLVKFLGDEDNRDTS